MPSRTPCPNPIRRLNITPLFLSASGPAPPRATVRETSPDIHLDHPETAALQTEFSGSAESSPLHCKNSANALAQAGGFSGIPCGRDLCRTLPVKTPQCRFHRVPEKDLAPRAEPAKCC